MKDRSFYSREEEGNKVNYKMQLLEFKTVIQHDLDKCTGCGICVISCPKEVIERVDTNEHVVINKIDGCSFCGVCDFMCPFNAWTLLINGEHKIQLKETPGNLPNLIYTELTCPRTNKPVKKYMEGVLNIYPEKCPKDCKKCVDACMMNVIEFSSLDKNRKVKTDEKQCIYCMACSVVCPEPEALELERTNINFDKKEVRSSSVFNEIIRKLLSQTALAKVLREKSLELSREAALKLINPKSTS